MEDLNKNQIILLTLLVSFVTSIATGIMTTSLLQQAPVEVTRNINSVVEKTIEKVVPPNILATAPTKEVTTVVVNQDDAVVASINKNLKSIVRIYERDTILDTVSLYGIGLVIDTSGIIITSRKTITPTNIYTVKMSDGKEFSLATIGLDKNTNYMMFKANQTDNSKYTFVPASLAQNDVQLGQSVIGLGGDITNAVAVGRVISLGLKESGTGTSTAKHLSSIETDVPVKDILNGSPLFDLSGNVVGMNLPDYASRVFSPVSIMKNEITILSEK